MKKRFIFLYFISILLITCLQTYCVLPNTITGTVSDPSTTINRPIDIAITSDNKFGYVVNNGNNTISIVDIATNMVTGIVTDADHTLNEPSSIAITPDNATAYISNEGNSTVSILDIATNHIVGIVAHGNFSTPVDIAITRDGTTAYVTNHGNNSVSIIDVATNTVSAMAIVSDPAHTLNLPKTVTISPDNTIAFVTNTDTVSIITIATNSIASVGGTISNIFGGDAPFDTIFIPGGIKSYISDFNNNEVFVVLGTTADTGFGVSRAQNFAITPDGNTVYVTQRTNSISIINSGTDLVESSVSDPSSTLNAPFAMTITSNGFTGYITNLDGNSVSIMFIKSPPVLINPPLSLTGCKTQNIFLTQTDFINFLVWSAPITGTAPIQYNIYRDSALTELVATIPANGALQYYDHNRNPQITYSYYVVAIDIDGNISTPSAITVTTPCK